MDDEKRSLHLMENTLPGWDLGNVDQKEEHIRIIVGDHDLPCALVCEVNGRIIVQFIEDGQSAESAGRKEQIIRELDYYFTELGKTDPWKYAIYHCGTASNIYSKVHWAYHYTTRKAEEDNTKSICIEYCMTSDYLDPEIITKTLEIIPTRAYRKGDEYSREATDEETKKIVKLIFKRPTGVWELDTKRLISEKVAEKHAKYLLSQLEPKKLEIQQFMQSIPKIEILFTIHYAPIWDLGIYEISSEILKRMSDISKHTEFIFEDFGKE